MSFYEDLQLSSDATQSDIKKAYRKLAKIHHPDKGGCEDKFKVISKAYAILSDEGLRARYDAGEDVENILSTQDMAVQNLCRVFDTVVSAHGFMADHTDLIRRMREEINEKTQMMDNDISEVNIDLCKFKVIKKRLKKADFLLPYIENTISAMKIRKTQIEEAIKVQGIMIELLEESKYDSDIDDNNEWMQLTEL